MTRAWKFMMGNYPDGYAITAEGEELGDGTWTMSAPGMGRSVGATFESARDNLLRHWKADHDHRNASAP